MARTQRSLEDNVEKLTTKTKRRKKKQNILSTDPKVIDVKSDTKFPHGRSFPYYLHPIKTNSFNKAWFRDYEDTCKHILRTKLQPKDYTLWHLVT